MGAWKTGIHSVVILYIHFGPMMGPCWVHSKAHDGPMFGPLWANLGPCLGP
jgi:hypothetical protein